MTRSTFIACALALLSSACTYRNEHEPMYEPSSPAGTPPDLAGDDGAAFGPFHVVSSSPAAGAADVPLGSAVVVRFSDFPDSSSLTPWGAVQLRSGATSFDLTATVDLIEKAVVITPRAQLAANTQYAVQIGASLVSMRGDAATATTLSFRTGSTPGGGLPSPPALTLAADVQPIFDASCVGACHGKNTASANLVLEASGAAQSLAQLSVERTAMVRVKPGDPAASYLLRKLIGTPDVIGAIMPNDGTSTMTAQQIRTISDWIAGGAN